MTEDQKDLGQLGRPIKPIEVISQKKFIIPTEVFDAFNFEIAKHFSGNSAVVTVDDVAAEIYRRMVGKLASYDDIYDNHWLDVEDVYRAEGWSVKYESPGFNESGNSFFTFSAKRKDR